VKGSQCLAPHAVCQPLGKEAADRLGDVHGLLCQDKSLFDTASSRTLELTAFGEGLAQQGQRTTKRHASMFLVALWPEQRGEFLAGVQVFFRHQVHEQRQRLTGGKGQDPLAVTDLWCAQKRQLKPTYGISRFLSRSFLGAALHSQQIG